MAVDDYLDSEVAVAAAATAALLSPPVRGVLRKGVVYATAGVMTAGDAVASVAKGAGRGMQRAVGRGGDGAASTGAAAARPARTSGRAGRTPTTTPETPGATTTPAENPAGA
jgi:hypothetical protein